MQSILLDTNLYENVMFTLQWKLFSGSAWTRLSKKIKKYIFISNPPFSLQNLSNYAISPDFQQKY